MRVWRLCKARYAEAAFSGEGARLYAGRWNPAGVSMVYASTSLALAAMEFFVHLDPSAAPSDLVFTAAEIPDGIKINRIEVDELPLDWREIDHPVLRRIGADWIKSNATVALLVPSVVVEGDWNVLLNPAHREFAKIRVEPPKAWSFDERMFNAR